MNQKDSDTIPADPTAQTEPPEYQLDSPPASEADEAPPPPLWHFTLVLAEVIFDARRSGIGSRRVQFFSKSPTSLFPAPRLQAIQQVAAHEATQTFPKEGNVKILEVILLNMSALGMMTDEEFYGINTDACEVKAADTNLAFNDPKVVPITGGPNS